MSYNIIALGAESVISFYPILMKLTTLDVPFNTFIRLSTYFIISLFLANYDVLKNIGYPKLFILAIINIIHITSSYHGFKALNPSLSESLFYTYPFINLILTTVFLKETMSYNKLLFIIPILFCIYNIYSADQKSEKQNFKLGIPMILLSAITESILYIILKTTDLGTNPWNSILIVYGLAALLYSVYYLYNNTDNIYGIVSNNKKEVGLIILVNIVIGLFGYGLKFATIPKIESTTYSIITYTGILSTLVFSYIFGIESFGTKKLLFIFGLILSLVSMHFIK